MWTTKEVVIISLATGIAFIFATIYSQRKIHQYIDNKITEKSTNPLASLLTKDMALAIPAASLGAPAQDTRIVEEIPPAPIEPKFHTPPPGAGERWTPLLI